MTTTNIINTYKSLSVYYENTLNKTRIFKHSDNHFTLLTNKKNFNYTYSLYTSLVLIKNHDLTRHFNYVSMLNKYPTITSSHNSPLFLDYFNPGVNQGLNLLNVNQKYLSDFTLLKQSAKKHLRKSDGSLAITIHKHNVDYLIHNLRTGMTSSYQSHIKQCTPVNHYPFVISLDSEFVDRNDDKYSLYKNQRINTPLSVGVKVTFMNDLYVNNYKTYIFNQNQYNHLKNNVVNPFLNRTLSYIDYKPSIYYHKTDLNPNNSVLIKDPCVFKTTLFEQIVKDYYKIQATCPSLEYIPPSEIKNIKSNQIKYIEILYYYSNRDLKNFFSNEIYQYIEPFLHTSRNTSFEKASTISPFGFLYKDSEIQMCFKVKINDLSGLNSRGLKELALCSNVDLGNKDILNNYKVNMTQAIYDKPNEFVEYQYSDVNVLFSIYCNYYATILEWYHELNLNYLPTIFSQSSCNEMRHTSGSITCKLLEAFIYGLNPYLEKTLRKISITLDRQDLQYQNLELVKGIELGSSKFLNHIKGSSLEASFVQGGRCTNECDKINSFPYTLDGDFESCYSSCLRNCDYILGLPCIINNPKGGFAMNLGVFLKTYKADLVENKWFAVVGTQKDEPLSFDQDLMVSKIVTTENLKKKLDNPNEMMDNMHLKGDQIVLTREIKHTVITSSTIEIIENVATNQEKRELYKKLHIIHCSFHPLHLKCSSIEEWMYKVENFIINKRPEPKSKVKRFSDILKNSYGSQAPHYWFPAPLENFVGKLINKRKEYKKKYLLTKDNKYYAFERNLKNISNTCFGIIASRFFTINNLIVANVVTNTARCQCWLYSKAFNAKNIITDGGFYQPSKVLDIKSFRKNPGFNTLYKIHTSEETEDLKHFKSLGNSDNQVFDWQKRIQNLHAEPIDQEAYNLSILADELANKHFHEFCSHYKLKPVFNIEHKSENISVCSVAIARGHYLMRTYTNKIKSKIRGTQTPSLKESIPSPVYQFLESRMFEMPGEDNTFMLKNICYTQKAFIKRHNKELVKKKLGNLYFQKDFSMHTSFISKKTFALSFDTGIYPDYKTFKLFTSPYAQYLSFFYLNSKCVIETCKEGLIIDKKILWKEFNRIKNDLKNNTATHRVSEKNKEEKIKWLTNAQKIDPYVEI